MTVEWLICQEPVHIGGTDSSSRGNNSPIFRLSDRTPVIPGSSLRGALREGAEQNQNISQFVNNWFGGENKKEENISPGAISLGWGWPVWFPIHVLGYGTWWVSCFSWLDRFCQLSGKTPINLNRNEIHSSNSSLKGESVYLRWLKLTKIQHYGEKLPIPNQIPPDRLIVVPDNSINILVDMGLVRQPRINLSDKSKEDNLSDKSKEDNLSDKPKEDNLVNHLFSVEGLPPGAVFMITWTTRKKVDSLQEWENFLRNEHYLGGLWSVGYGRIMISSLNEKE